MLHYKIYLISPGCPLPGVALQCRIVTYTTFYFIYLDHQHTRGIIHIKIHLISPGCPLPGVALQCRFMA